MRWLSVSALALSAAIGCDMDQTDESPPLRPAVDYACELDSDCEVRNVGNCCGYYPRCVSASFTPDLEAVAAYCEESGVMAVCGWPEITSCRCVDNTCRSLQDGQEI